MAELSESTNGQKSTNSRPSILFGHFSFIIGLISIVIHCTLQIFTAGLYLVNEETRFIVGNLITSLYFITALSGLIFGILSLVKEGRSIFGIIGLIASLLATLAQAYILFIVNTPFLFG
ncbi:MAG: hypothetical protein GF308_07335 [Candidatus Heimdallarchaeota archaeon]|nr:hypothetical protein [Candidatus Heimdallarchaeota archaeon]